MRNIRLTIEYDGTNYNGWQVQKSTLRLRSGLMVSVPRLRSGLVLSLSKDEVEPSKLRTIQGEIEKAIERITGKHSHLYGSGRTDSGVHAKAQVANFHTNSNIALEKLQQGLNALLPKDISIIKTQEADKDFHSRFKAKSKIYRYTILNRKSPSPFLNKYSLHIPYKLNFSLIKKEARALLGKHDFKSFQAADKKEKSTIRTIKNIIVKKNKKSIITIDIQADGFLYNMVRNIIGTLIEIARGKLPPGSMEKILKAKDRNKAGPTAPAKGLCLMEVRY